MSTTSSMIAVFFGLFAFMVGIMIMMLTIGIKKRYLVIFALVMGPFLGLFAKGIYDVFQAERMIEASMASTPQEYQVLEHRVLVIPIDQEGEATIRLTIPKGAELPDLPDGFEVKPTLDNDPVTYVSGSIDCPNSALFLIPTSIDQVTVQITYPDSTEARFTVLQ